MNNPNQNPDYLEATAARHPGGKVPEGMKQEPHRKDAPMAPLPRAEKFNNVSID
jgi:hypothetical protein